MQKIYYFIPDVLKLFASRPLWRYSSCSPPPPPPTPYHQCAVKTIVPSRLISTSIWAISYFFDSLAALCQGISYSCIYVDQHLSWKTHMKSLLIKLRCSLGAVCKVKPLLNRDTLLQLHHSLVNSHLLYRVQTWRYGNKKFCQKLQRVSNKF